MQEKRTGSGSRLRDLCSRLSRFFSVRRIVTTVAVGGVALLVAAQQQNGQQSSNSQPPGQPTPDRAWATSGPIAFTSKQADDKNAEAVNIERKKQLSDDTAKLVKLATDLKAEVDKTTKDTLSLNVIRKADEIEKLAHTVKEKMKVSPAN